MIIAIGSDRMMSAVARARHDVLKDHLKQAHLAIGSINSPMQCMMKEICAQCLQLHKDPVTGKETVVFSCFNQDQSLDLASSARHFEALGLQRSSDDDGNRCIVLDQKNAHDDLPPLRLRPLPSSASGK